MKLKKTPGNTKFDKYAKVYSCPSQQLVPLAVMWEKNLHKFKLI